MGKIRTVSSLLTGALVAAFVLVGAGSASASEGVGTLACGYWVDGSGGGNITNCSGYARWGVWEYYFPAGQTHRTCIGAGQTHHIGADSSIRSAYLSGESC